MAGKTKYTVLIDHLVGFTAGDKATEQELEANGGTVGHLLALGAISAEAQPPQKETEAS